MTSEEFRARMQEIANRRDIEEGHSDADDLMCQALRDLGYEDGVAIYRAMPKWYA